MGPDKRAAILNVLSDRPEGLTVKQAAALLGWRQHITSIRMAQMTWMVDPKVERSPQGEGSARVNNVYVYRLRAKLQSPAVGPPAWRPEIRVAERVTAAEGLDGRVA